MATVTIPAAEAPLLRRALAGQIRVIRRLSEYEWETTSRSGGTRRVVVRNGKSACTCELSTLGHQDCPHAAMTRAFVRYLGLEEESKSA